MATLPRTSPRNVKLVRAMGIDPGDAVSVEFAAGQDPHADDWEAIVHYVSDSGVGTDRRVQRVPRVAAEAWLRRDDPVQVTLADLSPADVGRTVTVRSHDGTTITGPLRGITTETDWITDIELGQDPDDAEPIAGSTTLTVQVGPWTCASLPPTTPVTVHAAWPTHERPRIDRVEWMSTDDDAAPPTDAQLGDEWQRGLLRMVFTRHGWEPKL